MWIRSQNGPTINFDNVESYDIKEHETKCSLIADFNPEFRRRFALIFQGTLAECVKLRDQLDRMLGAYSPIELLATNENRKPYSRGDTDEDEDNRKEIA